MYCTDQFNLSSVPPYVAPPQAELEEMVKVPTHGSNHFAKTSSLGNNQISLSHWENDFLSMALETRKL